MSSGLLLPVRFGAASYNLEIEFGGGTPGSCTFEVTVGRDYWVAGDLLETPPGDEDLLKILKDAIEAEAGGIVESIALTSDRKVEITTDGTTLNLLWSDAGTTLDPSVFGWTSSDTGAGTVLTSPNRGQGWWLPGGEIAFDSRNRPVPLRAQRRAMTGATKTTDFGESTDRREVSWQWLLQSVVLDEYESVTGGAFESWWVDYISKGERLRVYDDLSSTDFATYRIADLQDPMSRNEEYPVRWDVRLQLRSSS